jgi:hypothetical protein
MQHISLRNRLDALEAALGGSGTRIVITGGMPPSVPPAKESAPDTANNRVHPNVDLGSKTK